MMARVSTVGCRGMMANMAAAWNRTALDSDITSKGNIFHVGTDFDNARNKTKRQLFWPAT